MAQVQIVLSCIVVYLGGLSLVPHQELRSLHDIITAAHCHALYRSFLSPLMPLFAILFGTYLLGRRSRLLFYDSDEIWL